MSSSVVRVIRNFMRVGPRAWFKQMNTIGDTKAGRLVGVDARGNKFFENDTEDEIHMRTRWVEYSNRYGDMSEVEPAWHFWLGHGVTAPPNATLPEHLAHKAVPRPSDYINYTGTPGAYVPYSTVRPKLASWTWQPKVEQRA